MYLAFSDAENPGREFTEHDILTALDRLVPMSKSQRERIQYLRSWVVEGRAQSASVNENAAPVAETVPLQLSPRAPADEAHFAP